MSDALVILKNWLIDRHEEFGDETPSPQHVNDVIRVVTHHFGTTPVKYLGAGDNGAAFLADDGDIIKFTIDANEAILWNRLKNRNVPGITNLKEIANLSSSKTGDSPIYVLKAEYAPTPITPQQAKLIRTAQETAAAATKADLQALKAKGIPQKEIQERYKTRRAIRFVQQFEEIAAQDNEFAKIPALIMDLADKYGGYIYDLQPDNFRKNLNGEVILVDPSIPDLTGDIVKPQKLLYEDKINLTFDVIRIFYQ